MFEYPAKIERQDDGSFLVTFRDLPFGATDGDTFEEAVAEAVDCLEEVIAACIDDKMDIPSPSKPLPGERAIRLPAQTAAKAAVYVAVRESGIGNSELARRIGVDEREIRRILDPRHPTKLPRIESALVAMGYRLSVELSKIAA